MSRYSMMIQWSDEDQLFLVTIPEFADLVVMPCTHGENREEAIHNGEEVRRFPANKLPAVFDSAQPACTLSGVEG